MILAAAISLSAVKYTNSTALFASTAALQHLVVFLLHQSRYISNEIFGIFELVAVIFSLLRAAKGQSSKSIMVMGSDGVTCMIIKGCLCCYV